MVGIVPAGPILGSRQLAPPKKKAGDVNHNGYILFGTKWVVEPQK